MKCPEDIVREPLSGSREVCVQICVNLACRVQHAPHKERLPQVQVHHGVHIGAVHSDLHVTRRRRDRERLAAGDGGCRRGLGALLGVAAPRLVVDRIDDKGLLAGLGSPAKVGLLVVEGVDHAQLHENGLEVRDPPPLLIFGREDADLGLVQAVHKGQ